MMIAIDTTSAIIVTLFTLFSSFLRIIFELVNNRTPVGFQADRSEEKRVATNPLNVHHKAIPGSLALRTVLDTCQPPHLPR